MRGQKEGTCAARAAATDRLCCGSLEGRQALSLVLYGVPPRALRVRLCRAERRQEKERDREWGQSAGTARRKVCVGAEIKEALEDR